MKLFSKTLQSYRSFGLIVHIVDRQLSEHCDPQKGVVKAFVGRCGLSQSKPYIIMLLSARKSGLKVNDDPWAACSTITLNRHVFDVDAFKIVTDGT